MPNNAKVATAATVKDGIRLDALTLIGVFGTETERRALVRRSTGRVSSVEMGARVGSSKVVAISRDAVFLRSGGATTKLTMPRD